MDKLIPLAVALRVALVSIGVKKETDVGLLVSPSPFVPLIATVYEVQSNNPVAIALVELGEYEPLGNTIEGEGGVNTAECIKEFAPPVHDTVTELLVTVPITGVVRGPGGVS